MTPLGQFFLLIERQGIRLNMELLKVENLSKVYGTGEARVEALKKVTFSVCRGEFCAVVGESGSGKSTLLNCVGGLDQAEEGKVFLNGKKR